MTMRMTNDTLNFGCLLLVPICVLIRYLRRAMSSFATYMVGVALVLAGLIFGAIQLKVPAEWIIIGSLIVLGIGIMAAARKTKRPDSSA